MKKLFVALLSMVFMLTLAACGGVTLSADEALDIALKEAGLTRETITDLENHLDREDGITVYEIDFDADGVEYSFDVNADTGVVTKRDRDRID